MLTFTGWEKSCVIATGMYFYMTSKMHLKQKVNQLATSFKGKTLL